MPGKGRKVAARQAQVGRRRRRQTREGGASSPGTIAAESVVGNYEGPSSVAVDPVPDTVDDQSGVRNAINNRGFRPVSVRDGQLASNSMVKSECIRISIMACTLTSVLVILAVLI